MHFGARRRHSYAPIEVSIAGGLLVASGIRRRGPGPAGVLLVLGAQ